MEWHIWVANPPEVPNEKVELRASIDDPEMFMRSVSPRPLKNNQGVRNRFSQEWSSRKPLLVADRGDCLLKCFREVYEQCQGKQCRRLGATTPEFDVLSEANTHREVLGSINQLKKPKTVRPDGMHPKILKSPAETPTRPFTQRFKT